MDFLKRISIVIVAAVCACFSMSPAFATEEPTDDKQPTALTSKQSDTIIQNCSNIKQSLTQLQRVDSRTRTYLGSTYEAIAGRFITPLNLRMVKNGLPSVELFRIQNEFTAQQTDFRNRYIDYMRELESLIGIDCTHVPQEFYDKLEIVRTKREQLQQVTKEISNLADQQYQAVEDLRASL